MLRLLIALAGRNPVVDIGICVFVIGMFAAQLLGILLLARYVRKPPPPAGGAGAGRGAPGAAPAADPLACITLLLSLAAASLVTASLVVGPGVPGSVRPLVNLAAEYCYPIVIAAGAALLYSTPLLRVFREPRNARGRAAPAERASACPWSSPPSAPSSSPSLSVRAVASARSASLPATPTRPSPSRSAPRF
ncbi:uncharacterized protein [Setaria viridis]|uniref:uncharacterized protein n=1 Tax=Setaria viridis TaxID=4556 RepID=UPI0014937EC1|nr:uncharacterized protein LOC117854123 [Setaria viridis]